MLNVSPRRRPLRLEPWVCFPNQNERRRRGAKTRGCGIDLVSRRWRFDLFLFATHSSELYFSVLREGFSKVRRVMGDYFLRMTPHATREAPSSPSAA